MSEPARKSATCALVVDDEELVRKLVGRVVNEYFDSVTLMPGGQEALNALAESEFDLVITDIRMPDVDGLAVVQWISDHRGGTPVIAITGFADGNVENAIAARGATVLHKPFGASALRAAIEHALGFQSTD